MTRLLFAATPAEGDEDEPMPSQPAPSQKLSDQMLRSMTLASQPVPPAPTQRAPVPLFHDPPPPAATQAPPPPPPASLQPHAQLPPPSQMGGTQAATQADFATPADQFDLAYDPADRARSPARLEPNRAKRARGAEGGAPASLPDAGAGGAGRAADGNPWAPPGGGAAGGARRVAPRARSPPCYRSVFASEEAEAEYAPWRAPRPGAAAAALLSRFRADFRELGMLGQGSFSRVYRARHRLDGGEYAVKRSLREVPPGGEDFARWLQEAQTLAALPPHAGLVRYFGAWAEPGAEGGERLHTQLERCDVALAVHAALGARLREGDLAEVAAQVAAALAHCHAHGVAHLDVKPDNIYCLTPPENGGDGDGNGENGENGGGENEPAGGNAGAHGATAHGGSLLPPGTVFKLGDFGQAARLRGAGPAAAGAGAPVDEGDRRYLPPELLAGDHSALDKADVFSLGATLLELAAGAPLPDGGPAYRDLREGRLPLLPAVRAPLAALIRAMMAPRPADRPSAAKALRAPALRRTAAGAAAWAAANAAEPPAKAAPAAAPAAPVPAAMQGAGTAGAGGARAAYGGLVLQRSKA
jgi:wee1-like protein kinase